MIPRERKGIAAAAAARFDDRCKTGRAGDTGEYPSISLSLALCPLVSHEPLPEKVTPRVAAHPRIAHFRAVRTALFIAAKRRCETFYRTC